MTRQKEVTKKNETLTNNRIPDLTYWSENYTNHTQLNSNDNHHQLYPKLHTLNYNNQREDLVDDDKNNPQAKLPVLNWHNQNPNRKTV